MIVLRCMSGTKSSAAADMRGAASAGVATRAREAGSATGRALKPAAVPTAASSASDRIIIVQRRMRRRPQISSDQSRMCVLLGQKLV